MSAPEPMVPVKRLASLNRSTLPENTADNYEFAYVDIGSVTTGEMSIPEKTISFSEAPSRARRLARPGDVVISTVRTYLRAVARVPHSDVDLVFSTGFAVVHPNRDEVDGRYLSYAMQADPFTEAVEAVSVGISYPAVNASDIGNVKVWAPPLIEQRSIADFLDRETAQIDAMVDAQQRLVALLEERRNAAVKRAVFRGVRSDPLRPSGVEWIGDVPAHWQVLPLRRFAQFTTGITPPTEDEANYEAETNGRPWIRPEDLEPTGRPTVASRHLSPEGWDTVRPVPAGSILVCCIGATLGKVGITNVVAATNQQITAVTSSADDRYVFHALSASHQGLRLLSTGNTLPILNNDRLASIPVPIPPRDEQHEIAAYLDRSNMQTDALITRARVSIDLMKERRAALISAAVTGRIDVRTGIEQVERDLEEARV